VFRSDRAGLGAYDIWWAPVVDGRNGGTPARFRPCPDLFKSLGTRQGSLLYAGHRIKEEDRPTQTPPGTMPLLARADQA
jgi:hypothetical protein